MKTDYKNLSLFEAAVVVLIVVGLGLISLQIFIALPEGSRTQLGSALQVFEMSDAVAEVVKTHEIVNRYVFKGVGEFYNEFYLAMSEVLVPVGEGILDTTAVAQRTVAAGGSFMKEFVQLSDYLASNYANNNTAVTGVEAGAGGKIMGAYLEKLSQ